MAARFQILIAALMFGTTGTAQALAAVDAPVAVGAARIVVGGLLLALLAYGQRVLRPLWRRQNAGWVALAGVGVAVYQVAFFAAVERTGVAVGTVVAIGIGPIAAGAAEWLLDGVRPTTRWAIATAAAATGVAVLALGAAATSIDGFGVLLALTAGTGYGFYTVVAKRLLNRGCSPTAVMAGAFGTGAFMLIPILATADLAWLDTAHGWGLAVYLGVVPTALAYVLYARGLRHISAAETSTLTLAEPVTATLLGALLLDEHLGGPVIAGIFLVGVAMFILLAPALSRRRPVLT